MTMVIDDSVCDMRTFEADTSEDATSECPGLSADDRFSARDEVILQALATGHSQASAAELAEVTERTVRRRTADPAFRAELQARRRAVVERAVVQLVANMERAIATLVQLLDSPAEGTRLRAATALVDRGLDTSFSLDMGERLEALEDRARQQASL
jgi:hypothetical protein